MNKVQFNDFFKLKKLLDCTNFLQSTKSALFPLRGKVAQLSERKRVLCWSIYITY